MPPPDTSSTDDDQPPPPTEEYPSATPLSEPIQIPSKPRVSPIVAPTSDKPKETPSIFNRKKAKEKTEEEATSVLDKRAEPFDQEALSRVWKAFSESKQDAGDTDRLILNKEVKKSETHEIVMVLSSQLEVSFLEKIEVEMVQFLRTELQNDHVVIRREFIQEEERKKLYTSKDIFEEMAKQNPSLKDLKDRLGLDFDY